MGSPLARAARIRRAPHRLEPPIVQGAAGDRAGKLAGARLDRAFTSSSEASPPEAITGIETASASAMVASRLRPGEHAVARDVGVDDRGDAGILEAAGDVERGELGCLGPASHRHLAVARIEPDRDAPGKIARRLADEIGVAHRRGADDDAGHALLAASPRRSPCRGCRRRAGPGSPPPPGCGRPRRHSSASRRTRRRDRRRAGTRSPALSNTCAWLAGSRLNTVARAMSPCSRRTQRPSLRSIAGNRITGSTSGNWRSAPAPAAGSSPDGTGCRP